MQKNQLSVQATAPILGRKSSRSAGNRVIGIACLENEIVHHFRNKFIVENASVSADTEVIYSRKGGAA